MAYTQNIDINMLAKEKNPLQIKTYKSARQSLQRVSDSSVFVHLLLIIIRAARSLPLVCQLRL